MTVRRPIPDPPGPASRWPLLGALFGFGLAMLDFFAFRIAGVEMRLGTTDVGWAVALTYALSFAALGWAVGRLVQARRALAASEATIRSQLEALEQSRRRAVENETLATVGRMAAGVAHEVRNPLGVIRSSAALLVEALPPQHERRRAGEFVIAEVDRLNRFVGTLLDFSRPFSVDASPVDLLALGRRVALAAATEAGEGGPPVHVEAAGAPTVEADPDLLATAARTLLQNAGEAAGARGQVVLRVGQTGEQAWLEVADSGAGVSEADEARLGEAFFTTKPRGTGLGLAMVRRVVQEHGGRLEYRRGAGAGAGRAGACFRISLPLPGRTGGRPPESP